MGLAGATIADVLRTSKARGETSHPAPPAYSTGVPPITAGHRSIVRRVYEGSDMRNQQMQDLRGLLTHVLKTRQEWVDRTPYGTPESLQDRFLFNVLPLHEIGATATPPIFPPGRAPSPSMLDRILGFERESYRAFYPSAVVPGAI